MSWAALEAGDAELGAFGAGRLTATGVAYLATVDERAAPRLHPVTPILAPGHLFVFMEPTSPKGHDLARGSGYALHSAVEDADGGAGEFLVTGSGRRVEDPELRALAARHSSYAPAERYVLFELLVDAALRTTYAGDGAPQRRRWRRP